jgi:CTP synthase (UTP-ammonia lyase)
MVILNDFSTSVRKALEEINPNYMDLKGLVICGTHNPHSVEIFIKEITDARRSGLPTLLICFGYQLGAIEWARHFGGIRDATSEEFGTKGTFVVVKRPELKVGLHDGETWWSNYKVDIDWDIPKHFIAVPFHPEYQSSKDKPHPLLVEFIKKCTEYTK